MIIYIKITNLDLNDFVKIYRMFYPSRSNSRSYPYSAITKMMKVDENRSEIDETCDLVVHTRPKTLQAALRGTQEAVQEGPRRP